MGEIDKFFECRGLSFGDILIAAQPQLPGAQSADRISVRMAFYGSLKKFLLCIDIWAFSTCRDDSFRDCLNFGDATPRQGLKARAINPRRETKPSSGEFQSAVHLPPQR
jgi:hypothetical protein